ncbi:hypothetical protein Lser_V15G20211 [Lactuca serriola]
MSWGHSFRLLVVSHLLFATPTGYYPHIHLTGLDHLSSALQPKHALLLLFNFYLGWVDERTYTPTKKGVDAEIGSKSDFIVHHKPISIEIDATIGSNSTNKSFRTFTYTELAVASGNFMNKEYSPTLMDFIYKGWVNERTYGPTINGYGLAMYIRKMEIPTRKDIKLEHFNHPNLVKFFGYSLNDRKLFCVYEYISGITLDAYLYGESDTSLSWVARLKIAIGAAEGLAYFHKWNQPAYSQFKINLILVDKKEAPMNFLTDPQDGRSTLRPADILVFGWIGGKHACVDLTGVSPLVGLGSGGFAAACKVVKHENACRENQHVFVPFAFDTFGFLAPEAVDLLNRVQQIMPSNVISPRSTNVFFKRIGFAIQKGLAAQLVARLSSIDMH